LENTALVREERRGTRSRLNVVGSVGQVALVVEGLARLLIEGVSHRFGNLESYITAGEVVSGQIRMAHAILRIATLLVGISATVRTKRRAHQVMRHSRAHLATIGCNHVDGNEVIVRCLCSAKRSLTTVPRDCEGKIETEKLSWPRRKVLRSSIACSSEAFHDPRGGRGSEVKV
jgi:hypothetical protein